MENNKNKTIDASRALAEAISMQKELKNDVINLYESRWSLKIILKETRESDNVNEFSFPDGFLDVFNINPFLEGIKDEVSGYSGLDALDKITNFIDARFEKLLNKMRAVAKTYIDGIFGESQELDKRKSDWLAWIFPDPNDRQYLFDHRESLLRSG